MNRRSKLRRRYGRAHRGVWPFDTLKAAVKNARALGATHMARHLSGRGATFYKPVAGGFEQWSITRNGESYLQHGLHHVLAIESRAKPIHGGSK
jgi:hypothetical protein